MHMYIGQFARPRGYKTLFMPNSTEHEIYHAYSVKMPTVVSILTFIITINIASDSLKTRSLYFQHFKFMSSSNFMLS